MTTQTIQIPKDGYELDDDGLVKSIYVRGVPFGGPDYLGGKDLSGEYFDKDTDLGPLTQALSYFEHAKLGAKYPSHPAKNILDAFSKTCIGVAEKVMTDEEGVIYRVLVDRDYAYRSLLTALAQEKMLKASSTPFQRTVQINEKSGHIDQWHVVEVTLTVNPDNPDAEQVFGKILKEYGEELMAKKQPDKYVETPMPPGLEEPVREKGASAEVTASDASNAAEEETTATTPEAQAQVETPAAAEDAGGQQEKTATQKVKEIFEEKPTETPEADAEKAIDTVTLAQLLAQLDRLYVSIDGYAEVQKTVAEMEKTMKAVLGAVEDLQTAFPIFAEKVAERLQISIASEAQKTDAERQAEKTAQKRIERIGGKTADAHIIVSDLPEGAPR